MIALILAALAQQAAPAPAPAPAQADVVVTAAREREIRRVARQVAAVLPPLPLDQPLARFASPVCPGVSGLSATAAQAVVDRIGVVADSVGLKVGEPGCDPNLLVLVVPDGRAAIRRFVTRRQGNLRAQTLSDIRRIVAEPGSARAWVESEVRSRDGDPLTVESGGPPSLSVQGSSRAVLAFRRDIVSAVVVIDAAAVPSRDIGQIADYAALRGLSDARPGKVAAGETILSAFTPGGDATAPTALTALDRGILRGLYTGQGNVAVGVKQGTIVREIVSKAANSSEVLK
ncbi:MAG: hypothetical protein V4537_02125 [Pseudomonadota bacterium]